MGRPRVTTTCKHCGQLTRRNGWTYCSNACQQAYARAVRQAKAAITGVYSTTPRVALFILARDGHACSICRNTDWQGRPIPPVLDHIDGDAGNWQTRNLRLVCGNCDMQLPTYKNKNKGKGRAWRRRHYADGLSY